MLLRRPETMFRKIAARACSYMGCAGAHCWCGAALTAPAPDRGLAGGVCRRDPHHQQDRPPVGFAAGRYDHDVK